MRRAIRVLASWGVLVACATLPKAPPHALTTARLDNLPALTVCWLEYLRADGPSGPVMAGHVRTPRYHGTISGLLIKHPSGDILVDAGNSSHYEDEIRDYSLFRRLYLHQTSGRARRVALPADALRSFGVDPSQLLFVVLSHAHIDHAGGMVDLPGVEALMSKEEWEWMQVTAPRKTISAIPAHQKALEGRVKTIEWSDTPYETFDQSADLFGDGSVVLVKLFGHTPGSIGTFVNVSSARRIFHVGDAVILNEQIERRRGKGFGMKPTDSDYDAANLTVEKLAQLHELEPALAILPAHDRERWAQIFGDTPRCIDAETASR